MFRLYKIFLIIISIVQITWAVKAQDDQCQSVMTHIAWLMLKQDTTQMMKEMAPFMMFSMKGFAQYGDYEACERSYQYADVSMTFMMGGKETTSIIGGVCITDKCSISHLNQNMDQIQSLISFIVDQLQIKIPPAKFSFVDISVKPELGAYYYLTILLFIALIVVSFSLVILKLIEKLKTKKQQILIEDANQEDIQDRKDLQINNDESTEIENQQSVQLPQQDKQNNFILEDFNITKNLNTLFDQKIPDPNLIIFNGIRSIAFFEVIFGHVFIYCALSGNVQEAQTQLNKPLIMFVMNCMYSVDIFLWISGFFLSFVALDPKRRETSKNQGIGWLGMGILNRVLRIWPTYIATILIFAFIQPTIPSGPRSFVASSDCSYWYQHLLFYQNLPFAKKDNCVPQDWYLACDMQIFLVGILICYVYIQTNSKLGKALIFIALAVFQGYGTYYCFKHQNPIVYLNEFNPAFQDDYYLKSWTRAPPYFLGMMFGLLYREKKSELQRIGKKYRLLLSSVCYALSLSIIAYFFFGWYNALNQGIAFRPLNQQIFEQAFCRLLVSFAVGLMVLVNMAGISDPINTWFMGNPIFNFLSKISYVGYLIHWSIMLVILSIFYESPNTSLMVYLTYFVGITLITLVFSCILYLFIEAPFGNLVGRLKQKAVAKKREIQTQVVSKNKLIEEKL